MEELRLQAPAKLNLHLQVLRPRDDGFHDISSLFSLIDISDLLIFKRNEKSINLIESSPIEDNIVVKAAKLLKDYSGTNQGVSIELIKSIPDQKGLGGGSSDAATTLIGLNRLWELEISNKKLLDLALRLGSDVPFFMFGKTAWAEGRGEILREYPYIEKYFLLSFPKLKISTKEAFNSISIDNKAQLTAESYNKDKAFNSFEAWIRDRYPSIDKIFKELEVIGTPRLSGTGSTIFLEYNNLEKAQIAHKKFPELVLTKSLDRSPLLQIIE